jgi:hypothetical protein
VTSGPDLQLGKDLPFFFSPQHIKSFDVKEPGHAVHSFNVCAAKWLTTGSLQVKCPNL